MSAGTTAEQKVPVGRDQLRFHLQKGIRHFRVGAYQQCAAEMTAARAIEPENLTVEQYLAELREIDARLVESIDHYNRGSYAACQAALERVLELNPGDPAIAALVARMPELIAGTIKPEGDAADVGLVPIWTDPGPVARRRRWPLWLLLLLLLCGGAAWTLLRLWPQGGVPLSVAMRAPDASATGATTHDRLPVAPRQPAAVGADAQIPSTVAAASLPRRERRRRAARERPRRAAMTVSPKPPEPAGPPDASAPPPARLTVRSTPSGGVTLDGKAVGATPLVAVIVAPGHHTLEVTAAGHEAVRRTFNATAGGVATFDLALKRRPPPPPPKAATAPTAPSSPPPSPPRAPTHTIKLPGRRVATTGAEFSRVLGAVEREAGKATGRPFAGVTRRLRVYLQDEVLRMDGSATIFPRAYALAIVAGSRAKKTRQAIAADLLRLHRTKAR